VRRFFRDHLTPLRVILAADALFEFAVAAALFAAGGTIAGWLTISDGAALVLGAVFAAAGLAVAVVVVLPYAVFVRVLGLANVAGGSVCWILAAASWDNLAPEGRWIVIAVADMALALGIAQLLVLARDHDQARR